MKKKIINKPKAICGWCNKELKKGFDNEDWDNKGILIHQCKPQKPNKIDREKWDMNEIIDAINFLLK